MNLIGKWRFGPPADDFLPIGSFAAYDEPVESDRGSDHRRQKIVGGDFSGYGDVDEESEDTESLD